MREYLILRSFTGSQNGIDSESFEAGATRELSDSLVAALGGTNGGFVKEAGHAATEIANAPLALADAVLDAIAGIEPRELADGEMLEEGDLPELAEDRETKVTGPEETKPAKPLNKMSKAELVTYALTVHGLELVPDTMTVKDMIAAIEAAGNA